MLFTSAQQLIAKRSGSDHVPLQTLLPTKALITSRDPDSPVGRSTFTNNPRASINREKLSQRIDRARQPLR